MLSAISVNRECCSHQAISHCSPQLWTPRGFRMQKKRTVLIFEDRFQWAQTCHLPIQRKALNSLTWNAWFSLISSNLLKFSYLFFVCLNSCTPWLLPYLFGAVLQSYRRGCVPGLSPQSDCWMKHNSLVLGCLFSGKILAMINRRLHKLAPVHLSNSISNLPFRAHSTLTPLSSLFLKLTQSLFTCYT